MYVFWGWQQPSSTPVAYASQDVDLTAKIVASTCQVEVSNNGVVDLGTVTLDYFADNVTPTTDYAGGKILMLMSFPATIFKRRNHK